MTPLREKARELVTKALAERDTALDANVRGFMWDLDVWFRGLSNKAQAAWRPHIENLKLKVPNNRVPGQITEDDGIVLSTSMAKIASHAAEKQMKIDADCDLKLARIRDGYLKHLAIQLDNAEDSGHSGLARKIEEAIEEATVEPEALPGLFGFDIEPDPLPDVSDTETDPLPGVSDTETDPLPDQ